MAQILLEPVNPQEPAEVEEPVQEPAEPEAQEETEQAPEPVEEEVLTPLETVPEPSGSEVSAPAPKKRGRPPKAKAKPKAAPGLPKAKAARPATWRKRYEMCTSMLPNRHGDGHFAISRQQEAKRADPTARALGPAGQILTNI